MTKSSRDETSLHEQAAADGTRRLTEKKSAGVLSRVRNVMGKPGFWLACDAAGTALITTAALKLGGKIRASKQRATLAGAGAVASDGVFGREQCDRAFLHN